MRKKIYYLNKMTDYRNFPWNRLIINQLKEIIRLENLPILLSHSRKQDLINRIIEEFTIKPPENPRTIEILSRYEQTVQPSPEPRRHVISLPRPSRLPLSEMYFPEMEEEDPRSRQERPIHPQRQVSRLTLELPECQLTSTRRCDEGFSFIELELTPEEVEEKISSERRIFLKVRDRTICFDVVELADLFLSTSRNIIEGPFGSCRVPDNIVNEIIEKAELYRESSAPLHIIREPTPPPEFLISQERERRLLQGREFSLEDILRYPLEELSLENLMDLSRDIINEINRRTL